MIDDGAGVVLVVERKKRESNIIFIVFQEIC